MTGAGGPSPKEAIARGLVYAVHAKAAPDRPAIVSPNGDRTFGELNARCNQLMRALRARGLRPGDAVALLCANRPEFVEVLGAVSRAGYRVTPINWHLPGGDVGYIVANCEAVAFLADARFAESAEEAARVAPGAKVRLSVAGSIDGFEAYDDALAGESSEDPDDPVLGSSMLYTSGTTGRPKGVYRKGVARSSLVPPLRDTAAFEPGSDLALVTGPLYHAAPLALNLQFPLAYGVGTVLMDGWDAEETLALIERHRITHTHMVPTMFHRLLQLPDEVRAGYDTSSLRWVVHGAAPCPVHVKQRTLEWLGPIVYEYYAATEGGATFIGPDAWLRKPGSVGRRVDGTVVEVHDDAGKELPAGEVGTVFFRAPENRFSYYKAPGKTAEAYRGDYFSMGDMGYFDADGYLFLTGRSAEVIISGGVNIYPAEIDAVLLMHPAVADAATVGVPSDEWGEEVRAVVLLEEGRAPGPDLAAELVEHCREHLARYQCPRRVDFSEDLPRLPTGKIVRRLVRERYWTGRDKTI